jgi:putative tryptophan/tyrosine transport system substrate-binding protein
MMCWHMRRREFITLFGGAAAGWPLAALAQQTNRVRRIGVLIGFDRSDPEGQTRLAAFHQGLAAAGWTDGGNLRIDYRRFAGDADRVRAAAELVGLAPDVLLAYAPPAVAALQRETRSIPIVFAGVTATIRCALVSQRQIKLTALFLNLFPGMFGQRLQSLQWYLFLRSSINRHC